MVSVLFVDNEVTITQLGAQLIEASGFAVIVARDPLEAISIMADTVEIEIAILDYEMPVMNGCELAGRLRSLHPRLKIVLYSGAIDIPQSEMTNVDAFISKGDGMRRLLSQLVEFVQAGEGLEKTFWPKGPCVTQKIQKRQNRRRRQPRRSKPPRFTTQHTEKSKHDHLSRN